MTESEFNVLADAALDRLDAALESSGADVDWELKAGGVLEIESADGAKIIVNRHAAAREIWVAAKAGGFHYRYDEAAAGWVNTRGEEELFAALSRLVGELCGAPVKLG